jgi:hypothetical protein
MSSRILAKATAVGTLVLGAAALSGCASNGGSVASAGALQKAAAGGASSCTGSRLFLKIDAGSSGMGHTGSVLVFTNTGSNTCTLYGYPGADVTDNGQYNWAPYMNATRVSGGVTVRTVSLSPGSSASAMLEWDVNPKSGAGDTANAANCAGMAGGYLEITPPNTTVTNRSEPPENMCTDLQIFPVVAGTTGE